MGEGRLVAAPFLVKTYRLVDDPNTDNIISWGEQKKTFVVWRPKDLSRYLLPHYFNHNNFSSFVRQLNTYGFRKIARGRYEFGNELFKKGHEHLLCHIQRRKLPLTTQQMSTQQQQLSLSPSPSLSASPSSSQISDCSAAVADHPICPPASSDSLAEENETLKRKNVLLSSELVRLQSICRGLLLFVNNQHNSHPMTSPDELIMQMDKRLDHHDSGPKEGRSRSPPKLFGVPLFEENQVQSYKSGMENNTL